MRQTARVLTLAALWLAVSGAVLLSPGCYGRNCEGIVENYGSDAGQGQMLSADIWESAPIDGKWLWFPRQHYFIFDIRGFNGRKPQIIIPYVSAVEEPGTKGNFTVGAGNMTLISSPFPDRIDVKNDTCSDTFIRVVAIAAPMPPEVPSSADAAAPDEPDAGPTDAGEDD